MSRYVKLQLHAQHLRAKASIASCTPDIGLQLALPLYYSTISDQILLSLLPDRKNTYDLDKLPGPWKRAYPVVGNLLDCLTPDFHRKLLDWSDQYGGIYRMRFLWHDAIVVTDPLALGTIMGRGEHAIDKAFATYAPINKMCDPHGHANLLTAPADDKWKAIRKAVAVSFSAQNIKKKFPVILEKVNEVVVRSARLGPQASIDVDQTALRVTLDIIGLVSNNSYTSMAAFSMAERALKQGSGLVAVGAVAGLVGDTLAAA